MRDGTALDDHWVEATIVEGDNAQAIALSVDPKVTVGNTFYLLGLH